MSRIECLGSRADYVLYRKALQGLGVGLAQQIQPIKKYVDKNVDVIGKAFGLLGGTPSTAIQPVHLGLEGGEAVIENR